MTTHITLVFISFKCFMMFSDINIDVYLSFCDGSFLLPFKNKCNLSPGIAKDHV